MALVEVRGVSKAFWIPSVHRQTIREHLFGLFEPRRFQRLQVLEDVAFDLAPGEALGIMGRNGSGKSTLLKIISGVYLPDRGDVRTNAGITPVLELGVGWNPELDAIDNVMLVGSVMGLSLGEIRRGIDEILAFAELDIAEGDGGVDDAQRGLLAGDALEGLDGGGKVAGAHLLIAEGDSE